MSSFRNFFGYDAKDWAEEAGLHFSRAVRIAKYTGVIPYNWNDGRQEVEFSLSRTRFVIFVGQFLLILMYEGFLICRLISFTLDENSTTKDKGVLQYNAIACSLPIVCQFSSFSSVYDLYTYINCLLHYMRNNFKRLPHDGRKERTNGKLMKILPFVALGTFCLNMITLFRRPESPQLLTSVLPDVARRYKWALIPFALIHGYMWCNQWGVVLFHCALIVSSISATQNALNRTRLNPRLSSEGFYRASRELELLQGNTNALLRWMLFTVELVVVPIIVYAFCGSIRNDGAQAAKLLIVAVVGSGVLLKFFSGLGSIFETSSEVLAQWKKRAGLPSVLLRKQFKSMRPIRAQVGHYYVDAAVPLTLLAIISENTLNALLAA